MSTLQIFSVLGAVLILLAYGANQRGYTGPEHRGYSIANFLGSSVLAVIALVEQQWGFLLLEGVWALVSAWSIFRKPAAARRSD